MAHWDFLLCLFQLGFNALSSTHCAGRRKERGAVGSSGEEGGLAL